MIALACRELETSVRYWPVRAWFRISIAVISTDYSLRLIFKSKIFASNMNYGALAETVEFGKIYMSIQKSPKHRQQVEKYHRRMLIESFFHSIRWFSLGKGADSF